MSNKNSDLPGFYRDPKTGKYFRDNPAAARNRSLEKLKKENENRSKFLKGSTQYSKYANIFKILHTREIGPLSGVHYERDYCRMVTSNKKLTNEYDSKSNPRYVQLVRDNYIKVDYIRGTPSFVLGVWTVKDETKFESNLMSHQPLATNQRIAYDTPRTAVSSPTVTDLCEGPDSTVIYIYHDSRMSGLGWNKDQSLHLISQLVPNYRNNVQDPSAINHIKYTTDPLYCCTSTTDNSRVAIGSSSFFLYNRLDCLGVSEYGTYNWARAHTISFNHSSNLMVMGFHIGYISLWDERSCDFVTNLEISDYCINESYFLEPNQVIVAGLENVLCKVDLRMNSVVTEYLDHKTSMKKNALSVANNMLCATGTDNVIRIWHLSGGKPVHEMSSLLSPDNNVRGWLFNEANKTYLYHFEAGIRKTFSIN